MTYRPLSAQEEKIGRDVVDSAVKVHKVMGSGLLESVIDVLVEDLVICELKAVTEMNPVFAAQLLSYLKLANRRLGYLINFHTPLMKDGISRFVL